jgi:hypothetical protein
MAGNVMFPNKWGAAAADVWRPFTRAARACAIRASVATAGRTQSQVLFKHGAPFATPHKQIDVMCNIIKLTSKKQIKHEDVRV